MTSVTAAEQPDSLGGRDPEEDRGQADRRLMRSVGREVAVDQRGESGRGVVAEVAPPGT